MDESLKIPYKKMCVQSFIEKIIRSLHKTIVPIFLMIFDFVNKGTFSIQFLLLLAVVFIFIAIDALLDYLKTGYLVDFNAKVIRYYDFHGSYNQISIPFSKIENINTRRTLLQKVLGYYEVRIDSGSENKETEIELKINKKAMSEVMGLQVTEKKDEVLEQKTPFIDSIKFGIINSTIFRYFIPFTILIIEGLEKLTTRLGRAPESIETIKNTPLVLFYILVAYTLILLLYSVFITGLKMTNHRVTEISQEIYELKYGFLNEYKTAFSINKVRSAYFKQTVLARLFKKGTLYFEVIGFGDEKSETPAISLYTSFDGSLKKYSQMFKIEEFEINLKQGKLIGILSAFITSGSLFFLSAFVFEFKIRILLTLFTLILMIVSCILIHKTNGFQVNSRKLITSTGIFSRNVRILNICDIKNIRYKSSWFGNRLGYGNLLVYYHRNNFSKPIRVKNVRDVDAKELIIEFCSN